MRPVGRNEKKEYICEAIDCQMFLSLTPYGFPKARRNRWGGVSNSLFSIIYIANSSMETRNEYIAPRTRIVPLSVENAICGSPQKGGNEDVGYDDWWVE